MDHTEYRDRALDLHMALLNTVAVAIQYVPLSPTSDMLVSGGATPGNHSLKTTADAIDNVLRTFNALQRTLGLHKHDPGRFRL